MSTRKRWPYLIFAAVLLGLSAWLTSGFEPAAAAKPVEVEMPRRQTAEERHKVEARRTLPQPSAAADTSPPAPRRDPVLVAMPPEVREGAMVVEANALRNSDLGDALVACFVARAPGALDRARDGGFDPLRQLDRVSMFDETVMLSGDFSGLKLPGQGAEAYGDAKLFRSVRGEGEETTWAVWRGQAVLSGSAEDVKQAVDRLEGRGPSAPPVLGEGMAYGEMYGLLQPSAVGRLFDGVDPKLADFMKGAAQSVELHVDAMHDVGVVADVKGGDPKQVDELRRMLGGAIAAARARAVAEGQPEAAQVLDLSRVMLPQGDGRAFKLELGLPYEMLKAQLDRCVQGRRGAGDAGAPTP